MRDSFVFVQHWNANLPALAGKILGIHLAKNPQLQVKNPQTQAKIPEIARKCNRSCRQPAIKPRVDSPSNCR